MVTGRKDVEAETCSKRGKTLINNQLGGREVSLLLCSLVLLGKWKPLWDSGRLDYRLGRSGDASDRFGHCYVVRADHLRAKLGCQCRAPCSSVLMVPVPRPYLSYELFALLVVGVQQEQEFQDQLAFSQKCLQLCFDHGVKGLLPASERSISRNSKLASESVNINSVRYEGDKAYPLATTSQPCSEIDSVPATSSSCLEFGTNIQNQ
nr:uncharacterized protein LOC109178111 [Ipomoea batatas]GME18241.1 uncharacterized protein LOC109178111 [Ipomoea batatas]